MVTNRCSAIEVTSSRVMARGSKSAPSASENRTPCFRWFARALLGSQTTRIYVQDTYSNDGCQVVCRLGEQGGQGGHRQAVLASDVDAAHGSTPCPRHPVPVGPAGPCH